jgi:hypothetical protein
MSAVGRNSKNIIPSTGRAPPTPNPIAANRNAVMDQVGPKAIKIPKNPVMKSVELKARRRPSVSLSTPQTTEPHPMPKKSAIVVYRMAFSSRPNSVLRLGRLRASPTNHTLSSSHPLPARIYTEFQRLFRRVEEKRLTNSSH